MLDRASNATCLIDKLLQKELVDRSQGIKKRHQVNILVTPAGLELMAKSLLILTSSKKGTPTLRRRKLRYWEIYYINKETKIFFKRLYIQSMFKHSIVH